MSPEFIHAPLITAVVICVQPYESEALGAIGSLPYDDALYRDLSSHGRCTSSLVSDLVARSRAPDNFEPPWDWFPIRAIAHQVTLAPITPAKIPTFVADTSCNRSVPADLAQDNHIF